jgi:hypothetical protein
MGGNLWQWCEDRSSSDHRLGVLRGDSFSDINPSLLLSSARWFDIPGARIGNRGFRCVLTESESTPALSVDDWKRKAIEQYPDLAVTGSPLNALFVAKYKAYQGSSYFDAPDWPMRLAKECAAAIQGQ